MAADFSASSNDRQWFIVGRWQEYEGEGRANLLRIVAIGAFYIVQLVHYYGISEHTPEVDAFHQAATALAAAWTLIAVAILLCLRQRIFPAVLKFVSTGCDVVLLTALASLGGKANSPLVFVYFVIIALAAMRFSLRLIWCATLGGMLGYLALVGLTDTKWFDSEHAVPVVTQLVVLLSLALTGIMLGQVIRRVRALADEYAQRLTAQQRAK
jgi:hypothetical protein